MSDCNACTDTPVPSTEPCVTLTCAQRMCEATNAYHKLMMGAQVVEAQFGTERVRYTASNADQLKAYIAMLHNSCPSDDSKTILGLTGGGPLGLRFGCMPRRKCGC